MSKQPFISVAMCNYNYGQFIGPAIESVLAQDYDHWEMIVVDDGSTDDSREVISRYAEAHPGRIRPLFKENEGQGCGFNDCVSMAEGEVVCLMDSDDLWLPGKLSMVARWFSGRDDIALLQHNLEFMIGETPSGRNFHNQLACGDMLEQARNTLELPGFVPTSALAFRRSVLEKVLPIPKPFRTCADGYLTRTAMCHGFVCAEPGVYGYYRDHDSNSVQGNAGHNAARYINLLLVPHLNGYYRKHGISLEFPTPRFRPNFSQHFRDLKSFNPLQRLGCSYLYEDARDYLADKGILIDPTDRKLREMRKTFSGRECHVLGRSVDPDSLDWDGLTREFVFVADVNADLPQVRGLEQGMYCISDVKFWEKRWGISPNMLRFLEGTPNLFKLFELPARPRMRDFPHRESGKYLFKTVDRTRGVWKGDVTHDATKRLMWGHHVVLDMCLPLAFHLGFSRVHLHGCQWDYVHESGKLKDFFALFCHNNDYNLSESILPFQTAHGRTDLLWERSLQILSAEYGKQGMSIEHAAPDAGKTTSEKK